MKQCKTDSQGWLCDVLNCVNAIGKNEFSLNDIYQYEMHLQQLHPYNNNIRAKIRQQLQFLRNAGFIEFLDEGYYRKISSEDKKMKRYIIEIEETVSELFEIEAASEKEALRIAEAKYKNEEFVLEPGNITDVRFNIMSEKSR